jgi:hypothetical protein
MSCFCSRASTISDFLPHLNSHFASTVRSREMRARKRNGDTRIRYGVCTRATRNAEQQKHWTRCTEAKCSDQEQSKRVVGQASGHTKSVAPSATEHVGGLYPQLMASHIVPIALLEVSGSAREESEKKYFCLPQKSFLLKIKKFHTRSSNDVFSKTPNFK